MPYIILILFAMTGTLCFLEHRFSRKYNLLVYIILGFTLIMFAGFREVGIDPDSENYESAYRNYYSSSMLDSVDYSYILLSSFFNMFTTDVHSIFLFYAFWGITLKFIAFRQHSIVYFLPVVVYLSFYYELHELTQIRTGLMSGLFLLSIKPIAEGKRTKAFLLIILGAFFHISAIILLPFLFFKSNPLNIKWKILLVALIPAAYVMSILLTNTTLTSDIPYIGEKLILYQKAEQMGTASVSVNIKSPLLMLSIFLYYYLIVFSKAIEKEMKCYPIMIKIFGVALFSYVAFSFLPVLAERVCYLFRLVIVLLIPAISFTIRPKWVGLIVVMLVSIIFMNYGLRLLDFVFLWKVS
ncbi:MAG: EpsG family protein [Lachnospira sp.]